MTREELITIIKRKRSLLCVGLDTEPHLLPEHFRRLHDPVRALSLIHISEPTRPY